MSFETNIKRIQPGQTVWDNGERGSAKGLHVRASLSVTTFYVYYRTKAGRKRRPSIGSFPAITVGEARRRAKLILGRVAAGEDPKGQWDDSKSELNVDGLFDYTYKNHWEPSKLSASWKAQVGVLYRKQLSPRFGKEKISEVTTGSVREWLAEYEDRKILGNRAFAVFSKMFNFAIERELLPQGANPCAIVKKPKERKRNRFASMNELKQIGEILEEEKHLNPRAVAFIYLLMYSGARPSVIERATWDQLTMTEFEGRKYGVLKLAGKTTSSTGNEELVILPPQAVEILESLPIVSGQTICGIKLPKRLWNRIKESLGVTDLWARDLRRTFATLGLSQGESLGAIGELLNHQSTQTTKIYAKLIPAERMRAVARIGNTVENAMAKN